MAFSHFVAIEGLDASGKATQSKRLAARMQAALFSFPRYETPVGAVVRRQLQKLSSPDDNTIYQCLNLADKLDAAHEIRRHLLTATSVVCDRWIPSSYCYGKADGLDPEWLERMHASLPRADANIFLDVSPEEALRRRPEARDRYERDREKQTVVRANYKELWRRNFVETAGGNLKWVEVNGEGTVEEVEARIHGVLAARGIVVP